MPAAISAGHEGPAGRAVDPADGQTRPVDRRPGPSGEVRARGAPEGRRPMLGGKQRPARPSGRRPFHRPFRDADTPFRAANVGRKCGLFMVLGGLSVGPFAPAGCAPARTMKRYGHALSHICGARSAGGPAPDAGRGAARSSSNRGGADRTRSESRPMLGGETRAPSPRRAPSLRLAPASPSPAGSTRADLAGWPDRPGSPARARAGLTRIDSD